MKLYLAVVALMLVLVAHTEAQEEEATIEQHFANFHSKIKEIGGDLTQKTMDALKDFHEGEFATNTRNWFTEQFEKMKQKIDETFPKNK